MGASRSKVHLVLDQDNQNAKFSIKSSIKLTIKEIVDLRMRIKKVVREKNGIQLKQEMIDSEYDKYSRMKRKINTLRLKLMNFCWENDSDGVQSVYKAISSDINPLIFILCNRTRWQIHIIGKLHLYKYGMALDDALKEILFVRSNNSIDVQNVYKLLQFRIQDPVERDVVLLNDYIQNYRSKVLYLLEILMVKSNQELELVLTNYLSKYQQNFVDIFRKRCPSKPTLYFMSKVFECQRDGSDTGFSEELAVAKARQLYVATRSRFLGYDSSTITRILANLNDKQFESIVEAYKAKHKRDLRKDLSKKLTGSYALVVAARADNKFRFLARSLHSGLRDSKPDLEDAIRWVGAAANNHSNAFYTHTTIFLPPSFKSQSNAKVASP